MTEQMRKSVSYAFDFLTFLFLERGMEDRILSVYLFGSAVRSELDKESDIDIFINCEKADEELILKSTESAKKKFTASKDFDKWKGFDFVYPISIKVGLLIEWELKESIESEGIELFSKSIQQKNIERVVVFSFDLPKTKKSYLKIKRGLFGRIEKNYRSEGMVAKSGGKHMASNLFIIPKSAQNKFINFMHANKIKFSMMEFSKKTD